METKLFEFESYLKSIASLNLSGTSSSLSASFRQLSDGVTQYHTKAIKRLNEILAAYDGENGADLMEELLKLIVKHAKLS